MAPVSLLSRSICFVAHVTLIDDDDDDDDDDDSIVRWITVT